MQNIKILILDDRPEDIELLTREINKSTFDSSIRSSHDRSSYLEELQSFEPDLILSDYNLGSFSGLEALELARSEIPDIPFIIVSGFIGEQEAVNLIVDHGVNDYIIKDNLKKLNTSVIREIERFNLQRELNEKTEELQKLSMVASHTHNGVMIIDKEMNLEWVNDAYLELSGFEFNECVGKNFYSILKKGNSTDQLISEIKALLKSEEPFSRELVNESVTGMSYWVKLTCTPILEKDRSLQKYVAILEEITERKDAEIRLQENLERLEDSQRMGKLGHWEFDIGNRKFTYSESLYDVYDAHGLDKNPELSELWDLYTQASKQRLRRHILNSLKTGDQFEIDLKLKKTEKGQRSVRALGMPVRNKHGEITALKGITQDITERVLYEEKLQDNKELLQNITDNVTGAVTRYVFNDGAPDKIIFASRGVEDIYSCTQEEIMKDPDILWASICNEDSDRVNKASEDSRKHRKDFSESYRIVRPDGTLKWIRVVSRPVKSAKGDVWDTIAFDISELKELESELMKSNLKLSQAQEIAKLGYYEFFPSLDEMIWSDQLRNIFNLKEGERAPDPSEQSAYYSEDEMIVQQKKLDKCLRDKKPYEHISTLQFKDGTKKYIKSFNRYTENENGVPGISGSVLDITADQVKERLLAESEQRLDAAINGADLGIWDLNLKTGQNFTNANWWKMLGYDSGDMEFTFDFFNSILHPDDKDLPLKAIENIEQGGENKIDIVIRLKDKNGKWRRILDRGRVVEFDSEGNAQRIIGTHMDITERFILEEELSKTQTRFELAVEGAELGLWEMDLSTNTTFYNEKWYGMLGYKRDEIEFNAEFFIDTVHPNDLDRLLGEFNKILSEKQDSFELVLRARHKNGDYIWILDRAKVVEFNADGSPKTLAGSHLDISERIMAERSYMESNIKLRSLINSSPVGIYLIDAEGKIIDFWNPAAEEIFGYTSEEVMGNFLPFLNENQEDEFKEIISRINDGETISNKRLERYHKNGTLKTIEINTGPIFNEHNQIDSILVIVNDVTELVEKENHIQESLKEKETLLGEIHHRVKNNLAIVSGILEIQQFTAKDSSTLADAVNRIRSIAMVHEQLYNSDSFSRINIEEYYQNLVSSVLRSSGFGENKVTTIIDISANFISINQAVPLGLIINELLTNSVKHAFNDTGNEIEISLFPNPEGGFTFRYRDNGPGFDPEKIDTSGSMGWELLMSLLDQLHADHKLDTQNKFLLEFTFSESDRGSQSNISEPKSKFTADQ